LQLTTIPRTIIVSATATVSATSKSTTTAATGSSAHALGLSLVDAERAAVKLVPIEVAAGLLGIGRNHGHERKATNPPSVAIGGKETVDNLPLILEDLADGFLGSVETEITNVKLDLGTASGVETSHATGAESALAIGRSLATGLGLVDADGAAVELGLVHLGNGRLRGGAGAHSDEAKATWTASAALAGEKDVSDGAELAKNLTETVLIGACAKGIGAMCE
jgi:hypothetical protein